MNPPIVHSSFYYFRYLLFDDSVKVQKMAYYAMIKIYKNTLKVNFKKSKNKKLLID
jgi:hypothetical protein